MFQKWNLISPPQFVGLQNIQHLFNDPLLPQSLKATFLFSFISVPLSLILSFFLASLINREFRGIAIFRTIYYPAQYCPGNCHRAVVGVDVQYRIRTGQRDRPRLGRIKNPLVAEHDVGDSRFHRPDACGARAAR